MSPMQRVFRAAIVGILPVLIAGNLSAQQKITLQFTEDGKLSGTNIPRFLPPPCGKDCKDPYLLSAKMPLPLDFFSEEEKKIDSMARQMVTALKDPKSVLYKILECGDNEELRRLQNIVKDTTDILSWAIGDNDKIIPPKLKEYVSFIRLLNAIKDPPDVRDSLIRLLNEKYKEFSPYRLKVKGLLLDTSCIRFVPYPQEDDVCNCTQAGKRYIAIEFAIPYKLITKDLSVDSFQLVQYFTMKEFAIKRYNTMLREHAADIPKLKELQKIIRANTGDVEKMLAALDEIELANEKCTEAVRDSIKAVWSDRICKMKDTLDKKMGAYDCSSECDSENILFCSKVLPNWILQLVWLNGDLIRLNPFAFTNGNLTSIEPVLPQKEPEKTDEELDMSNTDANAKLAFWNAAIAHLQDSAMRMKPINIDSLEAMLNRLSKERDSAKLVMLKIAAIKKKASETKGTTDTRNRSNAEKLNDFVTVSKVKYKGWLVPYKLNPAVKSDKMWVRNYFYSNTGLSYNGKFHYTYPEDENVTLLVHNLTPGAAVKINESIVPSTDSSAWSLFAVDAIANAAQLYSSLSPVSSLVRTALQSWNTSLNKNDAPATLTFSATGFQAKVVRTNSVRDTTELNNYLREATNRNATVKVEVEGNTEVRQLTQKLNDNKALIMQLYRELIPKTPCFDNNDTCYIKYLKALLAFRSAPDLIDKELKAKEDTAATYFTYRHTLADSQATYINNYSISVAASAKADSLGQAFKTSSSVKVAKYHYFYLAAGLAYSPSGGAITSVDTANGNFQINRDEDRIRLIAGVRIYPFGLYNLKNPVSLFRDARFIHRFSVLVATGIPKPLQNLYLGGGLDVFPGLTISGGLHLQQQNKYEISNNQVKNKSTNYRGRGFFAITMDPTLFISAITTIFKN